MKLKLFFVLALCITFSPFIYSDIYIAGQITKKTPNGSFITLPVIWINGKIYNLGLRYIKNDDISGEAIDVMVKDKKIYVVGSINNRLFLWVNGRVLYVNGLIATDMALLNGNLAFIGQGDFKQSPIQCAPSLWVKGRINALDLPHTNSVYNGFTTGLFVDSGNTYISGYYITASLLFVPCVWINKQRIEIDAIHAITSSVWVSNSHVYVSGSFWQDGFPLPCYWKDGIEEELMIKNVTLRTGTAEKIILNGNSTWVVGSIGAKTPCYWRNGEIFTLPCSHSGKAISMAFYGDQIYIVGKTTDSNGLTKPCIWTRDEIRILPIDDAVSGQALSVFIDSN